MSLRGNFTGAGTSPEAQTLRGMRAHYRDTRQAPTEGGECPTCGTVRTTVETLRVHRWLAHDVKANAA